MAKYATEGNISHLSTLIIGWVKGLFSSANPLMDGTVAAGTSYKIAREDHRHPTDTSRAPYTPDETAIAADDEIVFADNSDSYHIKRSTIKFDGSTATKALTQRGTWETFNNYSLPTANGSTKGGVTLSDATNGTEGVNGGKAATPKAVSDALAAAIDYADNLDTGVISVNGETGAVVLDKSDIGLGNVDNTADADKEVLSATKLANVIDIDGVRFDGSSSIIHYFECATAASTATKTVTSPPYYDLVRGAWVAIKFTATNSVAVDNLKLQVGNTDAKPIRYRNAVLPSKDTLRANRIYLFVYDNTYWQLVGDLDTNTENTAGSNDTNSKIFVVGAGSQTTGSNGVQTYSHGEVWIDTNHHLYSNSKQVVNLSDTQALTNKTYNGYTLGAACEKSIGAVADGNTGLVTGDAVYDAIRDVLTTSAALVYHGTIGASADSPTITSLPTIYSRGDVYVVKTAGTYAGKVCEVGDMIICNTDNDIASSANNAHWDVIQSNIEPLTNTEIETAWQAGLTANGF